MQFYSVIDADGLVIEGGALPDGFPLPTPSVGTLIVHGGEAGIISHVSEEGWAERPALPAPVLDGRHLTWAGLPSGTVLRVGDCEVGDMVGETPDRDILFEEAGRYVVFAEPPAPWLPRDVVVEVA